MFLQMFPINIQLIVAPTSGNVWTDLLTIFANRISDIIPSVGQISTVVFAKLAEPTGFHEVSILKKKVEYLTKKVEALEID